MPRLPLIGSGQADAELLAAAKHIAVSQRHSQSRTKITVGLRRHISLDTRLVGSVERTLHEHVQPSFIHCRGIGISADLDGIEDAETRQIGLCAVHLTHRESPARTESHTLGYHRRAQLDRPHPHQREIRLPDCIGSTPSGITVHDHRYIARGESLQREWWRVARHRQPILSFVIVLSARYSIYSGWKK